MLSVGYFLAAIPVFGIIIICHELGHFLAAKAFGIRVQEFALGFGPPIGGFNRGETRYNLRLLIPLGGFVRMAGMDDAVTDDPRGFNQQKLWKRVLVIAAGPIMNFVLAALLYAMLMGYVGDYGTTVGRVTPNLPAAEAGLQVGDQIARVDNVPIARWEDLQGAIAGSAGKPLHFTIQRGAQTVELTITPKLQTDETGQTRGLLGIEPQRIPIGALTALGRGIYQTAYSIAMWFAALGMMLNGKLKPELSGPVGITILIAQATRSGVFQLLSLSAFLSINIGILNLLPIPALDGSRLMFMAFEWLRGRRMNPERENMIHFVGLVVLMALTALITYTELIRPHAVH